jgi:arabinan endo-1,5-alpha-L-arabinosidase
MRSGRVILAIYFLNIMALTDNLQAFYKLSDLSDSSGFNRTLTNNGNVSFASGKIGNAAVFDGSNELEGNFQIPFSDSASVSLWFNANSLPFECSLFGKRIESTPTVNLAIIYDGRVWLNDYTTPQMSSDAGIISQNTWYHIGFKTESGNMSLYINGSLIQTSQSTLATVGQFFIGSGSNINYFDGQIDAVGIWNRALSSAEFAELYNSGNGGEIVDGAWVPALPPPTLVKMQAPVKFFGKVKFGA